MNNSNLQVLCKATSAEANDKLVITGLASSTSKDLDGERVSLNALAQMYDQVRGLSLFLEHEHHLNSVIGTIVDAELKGEALYISAEILPTHEEFVRGLLDSGINMGFSIGGIASFDTPDKSLMTDFKLLEVSLVSLPANWDSFSTVVEEKSVTCKCLLSGLHELKKLGDDNIVEENINSIKPTAEEIIKSEAMPEEAPVEEVVEKSEEAIEEVSEEEKAAPEIEEKSEDIEEPSESEEAEKSTESEEVVEKACDEEEEKAVEEEPSFITRDELAAILDEFIAEKEEEIKADILASIESSKGIDAPQKPNVEAEGTSEEGNKSEDEEKMQVDGTLEPRAQGEEKDLTKIDQDIDRDGDSNKSEEDEEENRGSGNDKPVTAGKSEEAETEKAVTFEEEAEEPVVEEAPKSKYASYTEKQQAQEKSFLGSEERDFLGRNINYL